MSVKKSINKLTAKEHVLVEYILSHPGVSETNAVVACGWAEGSTAKVLNRPRVRKAITEALAKKTSAISNQVIKKAIVTRSIIEERALALANLSPDDTKGNATAQVNALRLLAEMGGHIVQQTKDLTEEFKGKSEAELEFFSTNGYWPGIVDAGQSGTSETKSESPITAQSNTKPN